MAQRESTAVCALTGRALIAVTRRISPAMERCELTHLERAAIDLDRAREQHRAYEQRLRNLGCRIESPGTLDGGDALRLDRTLYVGVSSRSNRSGIDQLGALLLRFGYRVQAVAQQGCLHLKSAITQVTSCSLLLATAS